MQINRRCQRFTIEATARINASPSCVWSVIVDLANYGEWNTFVPLMQSSLQTGSSLTMGVQLNQKRFVTVVETVTVVEPQHQIAWKTRYPSWFLHSERFQTITPLENGDTWYMTHEIFTGLMAPFLRFTLGKDIQHGFDSVALNLKKRAEALCL